MQRGKSTTEDRRIAEEVIAALEAAREAPAEDDLEQRRRDAALGRALREAAHALPDEPLIHVSWVTQSGRTSGMYLGDPSLAAHRWDVADAAARLIERLGTA